mgnify:CR=1 FL=1
MTPLISRTPLLVRQRSQWRQGLILFPRTVKEVVAKPLSSSILRASLRMWSVAFSRGLPHIPTIFMVDILISYAIYICPSPPARPSSDRGEEVYISSPNPQGMCEAESKSRIRFIATERGVHTGPREPGDQRRPFLRSA